MQQPLAADELTDLRETISEILAKGVVRLLVESQPTDATNNSANSPDEGLSSSRTDRSL